MPDPTLMDDIRHAATKRRFPNGDAYRGLDLTDAERLAARRGASLKAVEIEALENDILPERYVRNMNALTPADQIALLKSTVCVVGLGGLGGFTAEILARIGVGRLILIDGDRFEQSNLNRQLFSRPDLLDRPKVQAAEDRVRAVNAAVDVVAHETFLEPENAADLLADADAAADCLDTLKSRFVLQDAARACGVPLASAAAAGAIGQVTVVFPEDPGLETIYGAEGRTMARGAESSLGCLPHGVALVASAECSEIVKILLKKGNLLRNQLLVIDLTDNTFERMALG